MKKYLLILLFILFSTSAMADKGKVKAVIKEQGLGQTVEYAFGYLFKQFKVSQLFAMMETNRVHSVRYGKGLKVTIKDFKNSSRLYAEPKVD